MNFQHPDDASGTKKFLPPDIVYVLSKHSESNELNHAIDSEQPFQVVCFLTQFLDTGKPVITPGIHLIICYFVMAMKFA